MKKQFLLFVLLASLVQFTSFAQDTKNARKATLTPLVSEDDIRDLTIGDNIDLVLVQCDEPQRVNISTAIQNVSKLRITIAAGGVHLSTAKTVKPGERISVYATVHALENLTLTGNSFAMSRGILESRHLQVNLIDGARVALKSTGRVQVNTSGRYQITKESDEYSSVFASE